MGWDNGAGSGAQPRATAFFGNGLALSHLTGPAFLFSRSGYQQDSGSAWHGWFPAMLRLEGAGFWLSMAWVEPGHASLGGCWILAQHGMGGAWPCFAWRVLARRSDRSDPRPRHEPATFQFSGRGPAGSRMGQRAVQEEKIAWES